MHGYQLPDFQDVELSVAMTRELNDALIGHLDKGPNQEDLTFAYWKPSRGARRYTGVLHRLNLPLAGERILQGNVAFTAAYITRVLDERPADCGVALIHSHLGPGWQDMSDDDIVAERDRLGGLVASSTQLPLLGLTWGTDDTWSARFWLRASRKQYERRWATTVRSVGRQLRISYHPELRPAASSEPSQEATISVWGTRAQADVVRARIGIVGLGSVGSIVAEALSRTGIEQLTLIDHDVVEVRNLDRTLGAYPDDAKARTSKVESARRMVQHSHTSASISVIGVTDSVQGKQGLPNALDCDAIICCVDRPWPRHVLNVMSYAHLIPVVDGGILARVREDGRILHVDWRIHTVGPGNACLYCLDALRRSDVALDREGRLDDPDYLKGLSQADRERYGRRNVLAFSLSVAAHQILQLVGLISGNARVGGIGPQTYHAYPGEMTVRREGSCAADCDIPQLTAHAHDNMF
jgi:hypothetical protein